MDVRLPCKLKFHIYEDGQQKHLGDQCIHAEDDFLLKKDCRYERYCKSQKNEEQCPVLNQIFGNSHNLPQDAVMVCVRYAYYNIPYNSCGIFLPINDLHYKIQHILQVGYEEDLYYNYAEPYRSIP